MRRFGTLGCIALWATGCISNSVAQSASTLPQGQMRGGLGGGVVLAQPDSAFEGVPTEVSMRFGLLDRFDVGLKLSLLMLEVEPKVQLLRGPFDLSLAAAAGGQRGSGRSARRLGEGRRPPLRPSPAGRW